MLKSQLTALGISGPFENRANLITTYKTVKQRTAQFETICDVAQN